MKKRDAHPGRELFRFDSYQQWLATARARFDACGHGDDEWVMLDARGRVCRVGGQIQRASHEDAFPVVVYLIEDDRDNGVSLK